MLESVEWGEFNIYELFELQKITKMLSKESLSEKFSYPVYSSDSTNNGIVGYIDLPEFICNKARPIYITFGDHTRTFNIAKKSFSVLDNVKVLLPKFYSEKGLLFIITVWQKQIPNLGYSRHWKIAKNCILKLPTKNGQLALDFMENFVAELEAYLSAAGLKDCTLTAAEQSALVDFEQGKIPFGPFKVTDLFQVKNTFNILSRDIQPDSGTTPYVCASRENNAVSTYIAYDEKWKNTGDCIFIGGKTFVVTYQPQDFFSNDSHNLALYFKGNFPLSKLQSFFMIACLEKGLGQKYSWGDSISNKKIQADYFMLPEKNGKPDYDFMQTLLSAVQKTVIQDVVEYADRKIAATKTVIEQTQNKENP